MLVVLISRHWYKGPSKRYRRRAMEKVESEHVERRIDLTKEHVPELEIAVDIKSSAPVHGDWTPAEERHAKRKLSNQCRTNSQG